MQKDSLLKDTSIIEETKLDELGPLNSNKLIGDRKYPVRFLCRRSINDSTNYFTNFISTQAEKPADL